MDSAKTATWMSDVREDQLQQAPWNPRSKTPGVAVDRSSEAQKRIAQNNIAENKGHSSVNDRDGQCTFKRAIPRSGSATGPSFSWNKK
jgi:hypothetical protein